MGCMVLCRTFHTGCLWDIRMGCMVLCRTFHTGCLWDIRMGCMVLCRTFHTGCLWDIRMGCTVCSHWLSLGYTNGLYGLFTLAFSGIYEWVVWFYVEPFTLHLNKDRDREECTHLTDPETVSGIVFEGLFTHNEI